MARERNGIGVCGKKGSERVGIEEAQLLNNAYESLKNHAHMFKCIDFPSNHNPVLLEFK